MRLTPTRIALLSCTLVSLGACSLINSYDEVLPDDDGSTGGLGGQGGMTGSGGDDGSPGGADGTGGTDGTGGEPAVDPIEPGLVVVVADTDASTGTVEDRFIVALDPRTGLELTRTELGAYEAIAYEASRDVWFFVRDSKMQAARFNRVSLEFEMIGDEVSVVGVVEPQYVFAVTDSVTILDAQSVLNVYDTSDLEDIKVADEPQIPLPTKGDPGKRLWDARAVATNAGGSIYLLWTECSLECVVRLSRIQPSSPTANPPTVAVETLTGVLPDEVSSKNGVVGFDALAGLVLAYVPDYDLVAPNEGKLYRFNGSLSPQSDLPLKENGPRQVGLEVDACTSVGFMKDITAAPLVAAGLKPGAAQIDVSVGINGQGMAFEPYTRSLVLIQATGENAGVTAWESRGTTDEPAMAKRLATWKAPALTPFLVDVAAPRTPVCD